MVIHPSLNEQVDHLTGAKLKTIKMQVDKAKTEGKVAKSPSVSSISRAMTRPGGRGGIPARCALTKKVF